MAEPSPTTVLDGERRCNVIWLLVLILLILAIGGGIALSKFLFLLLIFALIVAVLGARRPV